MSAMHTVNMPLYARVAEYKRTNAVTGEQVCGPSPTNTHTCSTPWHKICCCIWPGKRLISRFPAASELQELLLSVTQGSTIVRALFSGSVLNQTKVFYWAIWNLLAKTLLWRERQGHLFEVDQIVDCISIQILKRKKIQNEIQLRMF